ncbi:MAG: DHH family phosphoesterase [Bacillota bacterium]
MKKEAELFIQAVQKYKALAIFIPGSPDPDAIASAYAIKLILNYYSIESVIYAEKKLSLPQNQILIDKLKIPVRFDEDINIKKYEAYIVPDFQNNRVDVFGDSIPCAVHIDHHARSSDAIKADYALLRADVGSTSTMVALILKELALDLSSEEMNSVATALMLGIQTDTDNYEHIKPLDVEALSYLSALADLSFIENINSLPPTPEMLFFYNKGTGNEVVYRDWGLYGIGFVESKNRDSIALAADMILKNRNHSLVAVFAVIENPNKGEMYLDVSLRSASSSVDLNKIIKRITPNGGGRQYKGAYQVKLDYFRDTPERELLWNVIEATTLDIFRRNRDTYYKAGIESLYENIKEKVIGLIKK